MSRAVYYNGDVTKPFLLEESRDLFVLRVAKGKMPGTVLASLPALQPFLGELRIRASFPASNTYVYQCIPASSERRDQIKALIKESRSPDVIYAGSVFSYSNSGIYQVYTENIFLKFDASVRESWIDSFLNRNGLAVKRTLSMGDNAYFVAAKESRGRDIFPFCEELLTHEEVEMCHPEMVSQLKRSNRSFAPERQIKPQLKADWWLRRTGVAEAWKYSKGANTRIAIIDDGLAMDHIAFKGRVIHPRDMMDVTGTKLPYHYLDEGHGTPCASVACSSDKRALGVAPDALLMPIRITGLGSVLQSEAIYYAVNNGADVISCSWGPPDGDPLDGDQKMVEYPLPDHTRLAFEYAATRGRKGRGTPIVFAAGNGKELVRYDGYASSEHVIAVAAINHRDRPTIYSDYGPPTYCAFPSGDFELGPDKNPCNATGIVAASADEAAYLLFSGTSASCPGVAGAIALMYSADPALRLPEVKDLLKLSCEKISVPGDDSSDHFGNGLLRVDQVVKNTIKRIKTELKSSAMGTEPFNAISLHIGINHVSTSYYGNNVPELHGCINDMKSMRELAEKIGYQTHVLTDDQATREAILSKIGELGNSVKEGGILFITYAGHGAPIRNEGGDKKDDADNQDGYDEAWVAYNGFLLDDELFNAFADITSRIRVVLVSDSCHSQSMSRVFRPMLADEERVRSIDAGAVDRILSRNNTNVRALRQSVQRKEKDRYDVYVKALSACGKNETAKEIGKSGVYTTALQKVYRQISGKTGVSYQQFVDLIASEIRRYQRPTVENSHNEDGAFDAQFPFDPGIVSLAGDGVQSTGDETNRVENAGLFFETGNLYVETGEQQNNERMGAMGGEAVVRARSQQARSGWDNAYEYLLANSSTVDFVEPETVSCMHFTKDDTSDVARDTGSYLHTYPDPESVGAPVPFIWHLDDQHSQLQKAARSVFPELVYGARNAVTKDLVKIGHIDTGYLPNHPALPVNLDLENSRRFNLGDDTAIDNDAILALMEQQGHGNATMAILAGNWVDVDITESGYKGFYGAIPYAKVLSIKISETVALLSGKNFAQAVDYAIEQGCDVITMSMAGLPSKVMAKAVNRAYEAGVVIVSAASNSFSRGPGIALPKRTLYPARYDRVIAATGATCNGKPYLNAYHEEETRAAGGLYMQTCYGPDNVLPTTIGAYTPNVSWFNKVASDKDPSYYVKSGGGTSSATPQVAAAAALYIQKHKEYLSQFKGEHAWKKAEIVRRALFESCDASTDYNFVYGRGLLRAYEALDDKYSPDKIVEVIRKADEAPEKRRLLGGLIGVYLNRSITSRNDDDLQEKLEDMMVAEITQLLHKDPDLFPYLDSAQLDKPEFSLDRPGFVEKIVQSKYASDFLKSQLSIEHSRHEPSIRAAHPEFNNRFIAGRNGNIRISARGINFTVSNKREYKEYYDGAAVWVDEFELGLESSRDLAIDGVRELEIDASDDSMESVMLVEKVYDDGIVMEWKSEALDGLQHRGARSFGIVSRGRSVYHFSSDELQPGERGLFDGVRKVFVKIMKWVAGKAIENSAAELSKMVDKLGDNRYEIMVFDLESPDNDQNPVWRNIDTLDARQIYADIDSDPRSVLITLPGLFSKVEKGFDEFLESAQVREQLLQNHCRYVLGLNMPTVVHGVKENADRFAELLQSKFSQPKICNVLARSRGGIVARHLFEVTWANGSDSPFRLNKLLMFGTPNQGTMIASSKNWKTLFNYTTNVARITLGTVVPVVPAVITAIKAVALGFVDLPGINDMEEDSQVIRQLNSLVLNRDNYYVFTSDFEPNHKLLKRLFDQLIIDRAIFHGEQNDGVTPVPGAIFKNPDIAGNVVRLDPAQYTVCDGGQQVSHFTYLHPQHPEIIKKVLAMI